MKPTRAFKQTLLRQMLFGLRLSTAATSLTLQERKAAVRLAADAAMASARGAGRRWTRALASRLLHQDRRRSSKQSFLHFVLGKQFVRLAKPPRPPRSKKTVRRSMAMLSAAVRRKRKEEKEEEEEEARRGRSSLVEKGTRALKRLVPGGEAMDGSLLLDESLDYVVALRTQVELMQSLLTTLEASKLRHVERRTDAQFWQRERKLHLLANEEEGN